MKAAPRRRRARGPARPQGLPSISTAASSGGGRFAGERREQLVLAVAGDARDPDDLAAADFERNAFQRGAEGRAGLLREAAHGEADRAVRGGPAFAAAGAPDIGADHQPGEFGGGRRLRVGAADDPAAAEHGCGAAEPANLLEPVADIEHRAALVRQPAQGLEQPFGFLRRQHGGRLVHDQQARALQQAADDLDALAHAHRQPGHPRRRVQRQAVGLRDGADCAGEPAPCGVRRQRQRDVLGDGQPLEQREMLEDHADAERARFGRVAGRRRPAIPAHRTRIRLQRAVEDFHQRRFAGAVLAQQRMDLACANGEVDTVVRNRAAKALDDAARLQKDISARHMRRFPKQDRPNLYQRPQIGTRPGKARRAGRPSPGPSRKREGRR